MRRILVLTGERQGARRARIGAALLPFGSIDVQDMHRQRQRISGGRYDLIVFDTRYASHNMEEKMRALYPGTPVVRVRGGPARILDALREALSR